MRPSLIASCVLIVLLYLASPSQAQVSPASVTEVISVENIEQLEPIAVFGSGVYTGTAAYHPAVDQLVVGGSLGLWIYDGLNLEADPQFIDLQQRVLDVTISSDGHYLAYATDEGVTVLNTETRDPLLMIPEANRVAFRPNATEVMVATYTYPNEPPYYPTLALELWDIERRADPIALPELPQLGLRLTQMDFSADGRFFAAAVATFPDDNCDQYSSSVALWDLEHLEAEPLTLASSAAFAFHPTEPVIVAAYHAWDNIGSGSTLKLWDYQDTTESELMMPGIDDSSFFAYDISQITFNSQGTEFIVIDPYHTWVWNYSSRQPVNTTTFDRTVRRPINRIPMDGSALWLFIESNQLTVSTLEMDVVTSTTLPIAFNNISVTPEAHGFISVLPSGETQIWQLRNLQPQLLVSTVTERTLMRGSTVLYVTDDEIHALNLATGAELVTLSLHAPIIDLALNDSGTLLAYRPADTFEWWDLVGNYTRDNLSRWQEEEGLSNDDIQTFGFAPDSDVLWVTAENQQRGEMLYLLDKQYQQWPRRFRFAGYSGNSAVALSPDSSYIFLSRAVYYGGSGSTLTDVFHFDEDVGMRYEDTFEGNAVDFVDAAVFYSTQVWAGVGSQTSLSFRQLPDLDVQSRISYGGDVFGGAAGLRLSNDGSRLLTFESSVSRCGGDFNSMSLWDVQTGTPIIMDEPISPFHDVAFSPDSSILALSEYRSLSLYNARNGELLLTLPAIHEAEISDLQFSSTGSLILTASQDGTVRLWGIGG